MRISNFLYSGFEFDEDEDLLKFKFKMANSILLIVAFFSTLFGALSDLGINDIGVIHSKVNYVYGFLTLMIIFYLRASKENYHTAAVLLLVFSLMTFTSALIFVPQDEFRVIWFYLLTFVAYMLLGSFSGIVVTVASILIIFVSNYFVDLELSDVAITSGILGLLIGSFLSRVYTNKIADYENSLREKNVALHLLASTDGLTGIMNKRSFDEITKKDFEASQVLYKDISLILLDLDHFKKVNDSYGHKVGDQVLIYFSKIIEGMLRKSDIFARIGGEEFAIVLFETDSQGASALAEKIRQEVEDSPIECRHGEIKVTTSVGVSQNRGSDELFEDIFLRADQALYQAKEYGRNQVSVIN